MLLFQVVLVVHHLLWTIDIQEAIKGGEQALKEQNMKLANDVDMLIQNLKDPSLTGAGRCTIKAMLIQQLYFKEYTEKIHREKITSENDFTWSSVLKVLMKENELFVSMFNVEIPYRYEYLGSVKRLVMTPKTHQGLLSLMQAFQLHYYGGIHGPCAVGKTSLIQELAVYIGTMLRIHAGSEHNTVLSITNFLCGVASSGCWAIFEDFDRATSCVMSYLSVCLEKLQQCVIKQEKAIILDNDKHIPVEKGFFIVKTSHVSYKGRNIVPDSLKNLFRPISITKPNLNMILKYTLRSYDFKEYSELAVKVFNFMNLFENQFSDVQGYHFGLRRIEVCLEVAFQSILNTGANEVDCLVEAIREDIIPAIKKDDIPVLDKMIKASFNVASKDKPCEFSQKERIAVLNTILDNYQSVIIVGPPFAGKSTILNDTAKQRGIKNVSVINPKSLPKDNFFGHFSKNGWSNGLLSNTLNNTIVNCQEESWLVFDGSLDHSWIENLNSVLDIKKLIYFDSGEIIYLPPKSKIIFECTHLDNITPASISRCSIFSIPKECLVWKDLFDRWFQKIRQEPWMEGHDVLLKDLFEWIIPPFLDLLPKVKTAVDVNANNLVLCSFHLFERILLDALPNLKERKYLRGWVQAAVVFGSIWSIGGCLLDEEERVIFDNGVREVIFGKSHQHPLPPSLNGKFDALPPLEGVMFDFVFDFKARGQWKHWNDIIKNSEIDEVYDVQNLLVPTIDNYRYTAILEAALEMKKPIMVVGPRGSGKSIYISNVLKNESVKKNHESHTLNFTPNITPKDIYDHFVKSLVKKKPRCYGTKSNKSFVMFIDNFELPIADKYGDQVPCEYINLYLDHGKIFDFDEYKDVDLVDTNVLCCANLRPGLNQRLSKRTVRHFHTITFTYPADDSLQRVFSTKMNMYLKTRQFPPEASGIVGPLVQSSIYIHDKIRKALLPVPSKSHYVFNVRDIENVVNGCMMLPKELSDNKKMYTRVWVHETLRVFNDQLTDSNDTALLFEQIKHCVKVIFRENFDSAFEHLGKVDGFVTEMNLRNLTFGDFIEIEDHKFYQEIPNFDLFGKQVKQLLSSHFEKLPKDTLNLDVFKYSLENISKVCRRLSQGNGNIILLGEPGTGRELTTRVACILKKAHFYTPIINQNFTTDMWKNDFKELMKKAGGHGQCCVLFLNPQFMNCDIFLNDINSFLTDYELPNLFSIEESYEINEQVHSYLKEINASETELTPAELFSKFKERCKENFHIIMKMSLNAEMISNTSQKYPKILDSCSVAVFKQWPDDALQKAAELHFEELPINREERKSVISCIKEIYIEILKIKATSVSEVYDNVEITPSSYLDCIKYFSSLFQSQLAVLTTKKKSYEEIVEKFEWIGKEIENLTNDIKEIQEQSVALDESVVDLTKQKDKENEILDGYTKEMLVEEEKYNAEVIVLNGYIKIVEDEFVEIKQKIKEYLGTLKNLSPVDIAQPTTLKKPNSTIKRTMSAICILLEVTPDMIPDPSSKKKDAELVPDYWGPGKRLLLDPEFIKMLEDFDIEAIPEDKMLLLRTDYMINEIDPNLLTKSTPVGEIICKWLKCIEIYVSIDEANKDKKEDLKIAQEKFDGVKDIYNIHKNKVNNQQETVKDLSNQIQENQERKKELHEESNFMQTKKSRGEELLNVLSQEHEWWQNEKARQERYLENLLGNTILFTTSMYYLSSFPDNFRISSQMKIEEIIKKNSIEYSDEDFRNSMFVEETDILQWEHMGLANDNFYVTNAIYLKMSPRWPLVVDPDSKIELWLSNVTENLQIIQADADNLADVIRESAEQGLTVLIKDVVSTIDLQLAKLIKKEYFVEKTESFVQIGSVTVKIHKDFKLILSSSCDTIQYPSFFQTNLLLINAISTNAGITDTLKRMVVTKERSDVDQKTNYFTLKYCEAYKLLNRDRNNIMKTMLNTDGNLLENEGSCKEIKSNLENIATYIAKMNKLNVIKNECLEIKTGYEPIAKHGSAIFFTIKKLEMLNKIYKYSFEWYKVLFMSSIENSNKSKILSKRIRYLCDHVTYNCFVQVTQSLYIKDKQTFSFMLCLDLMVQRNEIDEYEKKILLCEAGETSIENPCSKWISKKSWNELCNLENIEAFKGIIEDFSVNKKKWKVVYDSLEPDDMPFHQPWHKRLKKLHKVVVIRILRPDKMIEMLESFISENLGYKFIETITTDLVRLLSDSAPKVPVFLLLKESKNPLETIDKLSKKRVGQKSKEIKKFALVDESMGFICKTLVTCIKEGIWIVIQNCHFSQSAKASLDKIYNILKNTGDFNEDFRLWFVSKPVDFLGKMIPGNSIKYVIEPPRDMKDQILDILQNSFIDRELFENGVTGKEGYFSKLLYSLVFLLLKCNGRNIYKKQGGWSIKTVWTVIDVNFLINSMKSILQMYEGVSFSAIRFFCHQCNMKNRIKDSQDKALLECLVGDIIREDIITVNRFKLSDSPHIFVPNKILLSDVIEIVKALPQKVENDVFDMPDASQKDKDINEAFFVNRQLKFAFHMLNDNQIYSIETLLAKLENEFKAPEEQISFEALNYVLTHEIKTYEHFINHIISEVKSLASKLKGQTLLDPVSAELNQCLSRNRIPSPWSKRVDIGVNNVADFVTVIFKNYNYLCSLDLNKGKKY